MHADPATGPWLLLAYRLPREPSTPRISVWRKLKRLGVAQLGDGLVALPADARTREQLDWIAAEIIEADGEAGIWTAQPGSAALGRQVARAMTAARAAEYDKIRTEAATGRDLAEAARAVLVRRLRAELHRVQRRDFFPPAQRDLAEAAIAALATNPHAVTA
jgi:hypothetical protein